jgi:hypothetical protein
VACRRAAAPQHAPTRLGLWSRGDERNNRGSCGGRLSRGMTNGRRRVLVNRPRRRQAVRRRRNTSPGSHCTRPAASPASGDTSARGATRSTWSTAQQWQSNSARSHAGTIRRRRWADPAMFRGECRWHRTGSCGRSRPASDWSNRRTPASRLRSVAPVSWRDPRESRRMTRMAGLCRTRAGTSRK